MNLTGTSIHFIMRDLDGVLKINAKAAVITNAANGECEYRWSGDDTDTTGKFNSEFEIRYPGGAILTAPNMGHITVVIVEELGSATTPVPTTTP